METYIDCLDYQLEYLGVCMQEFFSLWDINNEATVSTEVTTYLC